MRGERQPAAVTERTYPLSHRWGGVALGDLLRGDLEPLALLGADLGVVPVPPARLAFLDTETTGLVGGAGCLVFLVGFAYFAGEVLRLEQHLLEDPTGETAFLRGLEARLRRFAGVVTFCGRAFDRPRLEDRFAFHGFPFRLPGRPHLDLHPLVRRLWGDRLPDLRLGTLEERLLGVRRGGDLPGYLCPEAYRLFLRGDGRLLGAVLRHNRQDVLSLVALAAVARREARRPRALRARLHLARAYARAGKAAAAAALLEEGVTAAPGDPLAGRALLEAGRHLQRAGCPAAAARLWERHWRAGRGGVELLVALAKHYEHRVGDRGRALRWTEEALRRAGPRERAALEHRAARLRRKGGGSTVGRRGGDARGAQDPGP